jgi:hypothetical protein
LEDITRLAEFAQAKKARSRGCGSVDTDHEALAKSQGYCLGAYGDVVNGARS